MTSELFHTVLPIFFSRTRERFAEESLLLCVENVKKSSKQEEIDHDSLQLELHGSFYSANPICIDRIDSYELPYRLRSHPPLSLCSPLPFVLSSLLDKLASVLSIQPKCVTIQTDDEGHIQLWRIKQEGNLNDRDFLKIIGVFSTDDQSTSAPYSLSIDQIQLPIAFKGDLLILIERKDNSLHMEFFNLLEFYAGCVKGLNNVETDVSTRNGTIHSEAMEYGICESKENVSEDQCLKNPCELTKMNGYVTKQQHLQSAPEIQTITTGTAGAINPKSETQSDAVINEIKTLILRNNKGLNKVEEQLSFGELGLDSLEMAEIEEIIRQQTTRNIGISTTWSIESIRDVLDQNSGRPEPKDTKLKETVEPFESHIAFKSELDLRAEDVPELKKGNNEVSERIGTSCSKTDEYDTCESKENSPTHIEDNELDKPKRIDVDYETIPLSMEERQLLIANQVYSESRAQFNEIVAFRVEQNDLGKLHAVAMILIMQYWKLRIIYGPETIVLSGTECYQTFKSRNLAQWNMEGIDISKEMSIQLLMDEDSKQRGRSSCLIGIKFHHIAIDGESLKILMNEMKSLLEQTDPEPKRGTVTSHHPGSDPAHLNYWKKLLSRHKNEKLPLGKLISSSVTITSFKGSAVTVNLPRDFSNILKSMRQNSACSDFSFLSSIFHIFLYKITQISRYCTGFAAYNRTAEEKDHIGCFVQMLPLLVTVDPQSSIRDAIQSVMKQIKECKRNMNVSFGEIVDTIGENSEHLPIYQLVLVLDRVSNFNDTVDVPIHFVKYQQMWFFQEDSNGKWRIRAEFMQDFHFDKEMKGLINQFICFLYKIAGTDQSLKISELSIVNRAQLMEIRELHKDSYFPAKNVIQMYSSQHNPKSFWKSGSETLSYEDVQKKSWKFARYIQQQYLQYYGITARADSCAVLFVSRRLHQPLAVLSAWKAGLCVLPVSLDWPLERIRSVLGLLTNPIVITDHVGLNSSLKEVAVLSPSFNGNELRLKQNTVTLNDLAYITCTSGTTGIPKSVCTEFKGHSNLVKEYTRKFALNERSIMYQVVNYGFDIFFADLDKVFSNGCSLIISMDKIPALEEMSTVTNAYIMPAFISNFDLNELDTLKYLESIQFGGETLSLDAWQALGDMDMQSFQEYGLTEQTVYTAVEKVKKNGDRRRIGSPYGNIFVYNRDADGQLMPMKYRGLLYTEGMLSRGYLAIPALNSSKFLKGLFGREFSTGDICDYRNGRPHFVARNDLQVKLNGRRIEIMEIQNCIECHHSVRKCVLTVYDNVISAFIQWKNEDDAVSLREYLETKLPYYMIPEYLNTIKHVPLNANGKIDLKQLKMNEKKTISMLDEQSNPSVEHKLVALMTKHLKKTIEKDDNFFEFGGNSVLAMIIIQELKRKGYEVNAMDFFRLKSARKIAKLCQKIDLKHTVDPEDMIPEELELNSSQLRLWSMREAHTDCHRIRMKLEFVGNLKPSRLHDAILATVAGNPFLRCMILTRKGKPKVEMLSLTEVYISFHEDEACSCDSAPFSLEFSRIGPDACQLLLNIDHIIADNVGLAIICSQIIEIYYGREVKFQSPPRKSARDPATKDWKAYLFNGKKQIHPEIPPMTSRNGRSVEINLAMYQENLKEICNSTDSTLFQMLVTAYVRSYQEIMGDNDVTVGITVANRDETNYNAVGMWTNTVPLRIRPQEINKTLLETVKEEVLAGMEYGNCNLTDIMKQCGLKTLPFETVLNMQQGSRDTVVTEDFQLNCSVQPNSDSMFPQSWIFSWKNDELHLSIEYMSSLYSEDEIKKWAELFEKNIQAITGYCTQKTILPEPKKTSQDTESRILTIYRSILKNSSATTSSDFFRMGGNSLLAVELAYQLEEEFGIRVTTTDVITNSSIEKMIEHLQVRQSEERKKAPEGPPTKQEASVIQKELLRMFRDERIEQRYNLSIEVELKLEVSLDELRVAFNTLILHHPMLRTVFSRTKKDYSITLWSGTECYCNLLSSDSSPRSMEPKSVFKQPGFQLKFEDKSRILTISYNHVIMDGHSIQLLIKNLMAVLSGKSAKEDTVWSFHAHLNEESRKNKEKCEAYWRKKILTLDHRAMEPFDQSVKRTTVTIPNLAKGLTTTGQEHNVTPFTVLLTLLSMSLKREGLPIVIGYPMNLRGGSHNDSSTYGIATLFSSQSPASESVENIKLFWKELQMNLEHCWMQFFDTSPYDVLLTFDSYTIREKKDFRVLSEQSSHKVPMEVFVDPGSDLVTVIPGSNSYSEVKIHSIFASLEEILKSWIRTEDGASTLNQLGPPVTATVSRDRSLGDFAMGPIPLSPQQLQMFFLSRTASSSNYILPHIFPLGPIEPSRIHSIFHSIIQQNEILRSRILWNGMEPVQEDLSLTESYHQLRIMDQSIEEVIQMECEAMKVDELHGSPIRMCVTGMDGREERVAILVTHHTVSDAWSTNILERQLEQFLSGDNSEPLRNEYSYMKYILELKPCYPIKEVYLDEVKRGCMKLEAKSSSDGIFEFSRIISSETIDKITVKESVTPFVVILNAVSDVICSHFSKDFINIMLPYANRCRKTKNVVGCFLNNLVLPTTQKQGLQEMSQNLFTIISDNIPYTKLLDAIRARTADPSVELSCVYVNGRYDLEMGGASMRQYLPVTSQFPIEIDYENEEEGKIRITMRIREAFLAKEAANRLFEKFLNLLEGFGSNDKVLQKVLEIAEKVLRRKVDKEDSFIRKGGNSLQAISYIEELEDAFEMDLEVRMIYECEDFKEIARRIEEILGIEKKETSRDENVFMNTQEDEKTIGNPGISGTQATVVTTPKAKEPDPDHVPYFEPQNIIKGLKCDIPSTSLSRGLLYFSSQDPNRTFIKTEETVLDYKTFYSRIQSMSHSIRNQYFQVTGCTIRPDSIIPVVSRNSPETIVFCLSVIASGAAYIPIDHSNPVTRIASILTESGALCYFGEDSQCGACTHLSITSVTKSRKSSLKCLNQPDDIAYVICTSGTTGTPKMVCAKHKSVSNLLVSATKDFSITPDDVIYQFTNFCYDNSVLEILMTIGSSASFFMEQGAFDPNRLAAAIQKHNITHCLLFPGIVSIFRARHLAAMQRLRYWITGAEKLPQTLMGQAIAAGIRVIQNYGPTETTAYCITRRMKTLDNSHCIGKPINNIQLSIDSRGLLYVNGACLMRGYMHGRRGMLYSKDCERWYETGDLVRVSTGKEVIFTERVDKQLKIRGHRVDPSEIEECARQIKGLQTVRVLQRNERLALFYSGNIPYHLRKDEQLRDYFLKFLPSFMLPDEFIHLKQLPLTKNSKIDESKLIELLEEDKVIQQESCMDLRELWIKVLDHSEFNAESNFFLVGGNSLKILKLKNLCDEALNCDISVDELLLNLEFVQMQNFVTKYKEASPEILNTTSRFREVTDPGMTDPTIVFIHALYGGSAAYTHLIKELLKRKDYRILCIDQPKKDEFASFSDMVSVYVSELRIILNGPTVLIGASIGGTIAREMSLHLDNCSLIMIDSSAEVEKLKENTFEQHVEDVHSTLSQFSIPKKVLPESSVDDLLTSSWQLLQYLAQYKMCRSSSAVTLLSTDGTDLGWSRFNKAVVKRIPGSHQTMLNQENSPILGETIQRIVERSSGP